ncbi:MAG: Holliday junction branch migration protein RuvA [Patescibacteria group bacterium]|nr:Holliday junction branch migration protein RuvA [Patescibacteria group bacterium]
MAYSVHKNIVMIYALTGTLQEKGGNRFVIEVGGVSFDLRSSANSVKSLPQVGEKVKVLTYLHVREDALELYGFLDAAERDLFQMLIGVSGIGPKSALGILGIEQVENLKAAISEGRTELLTKASGIGTKTAERIILELRTKLVQPGSEKIVGIMESDHDIVEALVNLGYGKSQARNALTRIDPKVTKMEDRIREALQLLKSK